MTSRRSSPISTSTRQRWRRPAPDPISRMKVLGIDPGTATVGYGVVERPEAPGAAAHLVECGVLRTAPRETLQQRLVLLHEGLRELIARHHPDVLAVENIFYAANVRTTVVLGHARG